MFLIFDIGTLGWRGVCFVDKPDLKLTKVYLSLLPQGWD